MLLVAAVLLASGCGEDEPEVARPAEPVYCPSETQDWDARELLGKSLADAESTAAEHSCTVRVAVEDGENLILTMDLLPDRVNVETSDDVVVGIQNVG